MGWIIWHMLPPPDQQAPGHQLPKHHPSAIMDRAIHSHHPVHRYEQNQPDYINYLAELAPAGVSGKAILFFIVVMVAPFMLCTILGLALIAITLYEYTQKEQTLENDRHAHTDSTQEDDRREGGTRKVILTEQTNSQAQMGKGLSRGFQVHLP